MPRRVAAVPVRVVEEPERLDLLDASLTLAQTQIVGQLADETSLDGRTMGTLGFNGALLAADIAAKDLLGRYWWTPLIGITVATLLCLRPALGLRGDFKQNTDLGPGAVAFYARLE